MCGVRDRKQHIRKTAACWYSGCWQECNSFELWRVRTAVWEFVHRVMVVAHSYLLTAPAFPQPHWRVTEANIIKQLASNSQTISHNTICWRDGIFRVRGRWEVRERTDGRRTCFYPVCVVLTLPKDSTHLTVFRMQVKACEEVAGGNGRWDKTCKPGVTVVRGQEFPGGLTVYRPLLGSCFLWAVYGGWTNLISCLEKLAHGVKKKSVE